MITVTLSGLSLFFSYKEVADRLGDFLTLRYLVYFVIIIVVVEIFFYIWYHISIYLFYNDFTKSMSSYLASSSKHDVWHLSKALKEYKRVLTFSKGANFQSMKISIQNEYKRFATLTKHTFGDIFSDLEKVLSSSLYNQVEINLQLFPNDFNISSIDAFKELSGLQYWDAFVEDGRMNTRDSVLRPLTETMKQLIFTNNLTKIYNLNDDGTGVIFILAAKSFSEFPQIYGFLEIKWGKLSRPFMDDNFIKDYIIPILLERVNILCYYVWNVDAFMRGIPHKTFQHNSKQYGKYLKSLKYDFLQILREKYNE